MKPLLVVAGSQVSVVLVPNPNKQYALQFGAFLAKHDLKVDLQQGMLADITSNQDSTAVPVAFLGALQQAAVAGRSLGSAFADTVNGSGGRLQIYDIIFDYEGNVVGLRPLVRDRDLIRVPAGMTVNVPAPIAPSSPAPAPAPVSPLPGAKPDCTAKPKPAGC